MDVIADSCVDFVVRLVVQFASPALEILGLGPVGTHRTCYAYMAFIPVTQRDSARARVRSRGLTFTNSCRD